MAITKVSRNLLSTGIDDQSNATAITIDSSENVGIGVVPSAWRTAYPDKAIDLGTHSALYDQFGGSTFLANNFYRSNDNSFKYKTTAGATAISLDAGSLSFSNAPSGTAGTTATFTTRMTLDSSGVLSVPAGYYVGGTAAANLLDDYEEGTWTPTLSFGGGTTGIGYGQQSGTYTKIGNIVCANFTIVLNSKGSSTGAAVVSALPYAVGFANHAFFIYSDRVTTTGGVVVGYIASGTSIAVYNQVSGGNSELTNTAFANDSYISGVFTYTTNG